MAKRAPVLKEEPVNESGVVRLTQVERVLGLYLRGLLGLQVAIVGMAEPTARWTRFLRFFPAASSDGGAPVPSYTDGVALYLPATIALLPHRGDNLRLYKSMAMLCAAHILKGSLAYVRWFAPSAEKRLALDLFVLLENARLERELGGEFKGLAVDLAVLRRQSWEVRPSVRDVSGKDAVVEALVQHVLSGTTRQELAPSARTLLGEMVSRISRRPPNVAMDAARLALELAEDMAAVRGRHHPCAPVLHWPRIRPEVVLSAQQETVGDEKVEQGGRLPQQAGGTRTAPENARTTRRQGSGVPLHGGLPRDLAGARATLAPRDSDAAEQDARIVSGSQPPEKPRSARTVEPSGRQAPAEVSLGTWVARAELDGEGQVFVYDEWDYRIDAYRSGACLLRQEPLPMSFGLDAQPEMEPERGLSRHVRLQFELLRPERRWRRRELDGEKIDLDAVVEAVVDRHAGRSPEERLYTARSERVRDIAAALLVDLSASTETWVKDVRRVVDVEREALLVISTALETVGDSYAIYGFSSKVEKGCAFYRIKGFGEKYGQAVRARIQVLTGRGYTRMGVPIRHATRLLSATEARVKLLLVLSDGKPNEVGIYQGQYAVEDTRRAVLEARERGIFPFGLTIDRGDRSYLPRIFGPRGYAVIDDALNLPSRLAEVYRRLTS